MSLQKFFTPESVAVVGASRTPGKAGNVIVSNLLHLGFGGRIYPVNPQADVILGLKTYPTVSSLPEVVDVAVIATPSAYVPQIMRDVASTNVKRAIIITSGFAEGGEKGRLIEEEVMNIARAAGVRIVGPNTTGITSTDSMFCTSFIPIQLLPPGPVAFVAQTGLFLGVLLETILSEEHFGISKVAGLGNKVDVDDSEVLQYLVDDEKTQVICFYIEGLKKARKFFETARRVSHRKPILLVKAGVTEEGSRAALSHTASLSGNDQLFSAMCRQAGIIRVDDLEELVEAAKAYAFQPLPKGKRTAVVHYTGAGCVMGADSVIKEGLDIAPLQEETLDALRKITPPWHTLRNPVDLWPSIESAGADVAFDTITEKLVEDENVDGIVLAFGAMRGLPLPWPHTNRFCGKKPILVAVEGDREKCITIIEALEALKIPCYRSVQRAVCALSHMAAFKAQEP